MSAPHSDCAKSLRELAASRGIEVTASDYRPGMKMPDGFDDLAMECPHGIRMWMEPTLDQRLKWIKEAAR